ncbi:acetolactate synthase-1/2/3 large subunit [Sporobacter termitidis DSM 10068]|uniref:Acetolactate synthase-1/2/3 large subunit n=1 Tax=Sporobacter termitidis DSM 10068 TaxID=1123282 RepID=A0A1M5YLW5_9FIRM|nr:thiamine pyrophosphate-requiring protein [Sporobacter termitidis]SHI12966.1 acetolactate synthase-1/2/3 large subunit [Sporobacter termitidis DSM 10068]
MECTDNETIYTGADALTDALVDAGVTHVFLNSGTDYPPIIESWAKYEAAGLKKPQVIISPHEYAALSAAQGFAQLTGQPQAVFVHVDVGTQNLGGAVHNAFRCRTPVYILAGVSPYTMEGELRGGRNAQIQFLQNTGDQPGIVRGYTKMNYELRSGKNIPQMVWRALQLAKSDPQGPVYTMASREVLEEPGAKIGADLKAWAPVAPGSLDGDSLDALTSALLGAVKPLIVTSYLGRNAAAVGELVRLSTSLAIPVVEMYHANMNFPGGNEMHLGFDSHSLLKDADVVLVIDSDVPWVPAAAQPGRDCRVFYLDVDPLKETIPLWYIPSERFMKADSCTALRQINKKLSENPGLLQRELIERRREKVSARHREMRAEWQEDALDGSVMSSAFVARCVREVVSEDTVILNEAITDRPAVDRQLVRTKPGTLFSSGGSSLGWHGGAAVGMKLACPDKDIVALTGDGTYIFSCPTAVYWMARRYNAPFMTVIFNNRGWNAPKMITKGEHPGGCAEQCNTFWADFDPPAQLDMIAAAAGGAFAKTVSDPKELKDALLAGREAVENGMPAVINVLMDTRV